MATGLGGAGFVHFYGQVGAALLGAVIQQLGLRDDVTKIWNQRTR